MRGDKGRFFPPKYETRRIDRDIQLHQRAFGQVVAWYFFNPTNTRTDSVYDEGNDVAVTGGRRWRGPIPIPVLSAVRREGVRTTTDDGQFVLDTLDVRLSHEQTRRVGLLPDMSQNTELHLRDRIIYDDRVFGIRDISVTGQFEAAGHDVMLRILGVRVRPDELVNDLDFVRWSA